MILKLIMNLKKKLHDDYIDEIKSLEKLLARDLSIWKK